MQVALILLTCHEMCLTSLLCVWMLLTAVYSLLHVYSLHKNLDRSILYVWRQDNYRQEHDPKVIEHNIICHIMSMAYTESCLVNSKLVTIHEFWAQFSSLKTTCSAFCMSI